MKKIIFVIFISLIITQTKASVIKNLKSTPVTKFDFLLKDYRDAINLQIVRYMNETDNFRVRLDQLKMNFTFDEEMQLFIIDLYARADQRRYSEKKIKIRNRDCNIIRNRIFVNKYRAYCIVFNFTVVLFTCTANRIFSILNY